MMRPRRLDPGATSSRAAASLSLLSRPPLRTHLRNVAPLQPILLAIDSIAAH